MATTLQQIRKEALVHNRETEASLIDGLAEILAAYEFLRRKVRDLLDAVDYVYVCNDTERSYDARVRDLVGAAHALAVLDALTGGGR